MNKIFNIIKHEVEVENPETKVKSTVTLSGMNDFF